MNIKNEQAKIWSQCGDQIVEWYWENKSHRDRCSWFSRQITGYKINSIFEIGIMGGANVQVLTKNLEIKKYGGIDVGEKSINWAKTKMPLGDFKQQSIYDMDEDPKYDLVFTAGVLIHIPPDGIDAALKKCISKSNKYVMHLEGQDNDVIQKGPKMYNPSKVGKRFQWMPNLVRRYNKMGYNVQTIDFPKQFRSRDLSKLLIIKV